MAILVAVPVIGLAVYFVYTKLIFPLLFSSLRTIPTAHPTARFTSAWISHQRRTGYETRSIYAAHQKYGPIVLLGPNEVSVQSLDGLRQIYTGGFDKDAWYSSFTNFGVPNLVSMLDFKPHSTQKKMLSHLYSKSYLFGSLDLEKVTRFMVWERVLPTVWNIAGRKEVGAKKEGEEVDVFQLSKAIGTDFTAAYLWGVSNATDLIRDEKARRDWLHLFFTKTRLQPGHAQASLELEARLMEICKQAVELDEKISTLEKLPENVSRPVVFIKMYNDCRSVLGMTPDQALIQAASEMFDHILAGLDTTGITITYLMYELSRRPDLQKALRKELQSMSSTFTYHDLSNSSTGINTLSLPKASELDALPLLNAIMQETLRIYASAPAPQPRVVPAAGTIIEGHAIPGGVTVSTSAYCMHRNEDTYPDPFAFKPERWIVQGENKGGANGTEKMRRWFWAFGSGGRMCVGSNFAVHMLKAITAAVYTNFETTVVDDEGIEQRDSYIAGPVGNKLILRFDVVDDGKGR